MPYNQYVRLAYSFLHGKVYIVHYEPWLEVAKYHGHAYSHQGVLPGILLIPFVAVFGEGFPIRLFAAFLGAGIGAAAWSLATRIGLQGRDRLLGWAFPVVGTTFWYEAKHGTTWGVAALASGLFLFLSLNEWFGKRRLPLVGLFVGLATASRPPTLLAAAVYGIAILVDPQTRLTIRDVGEKAVRLAVGLVGPGVVIVAYNLLRFGSIFDKSGHLHYIQDPYRLQVAPGMFAIAHVPFNLYSWFFLGPQFQASFPYLRLGILGQAITLTSPAFVAAFGARRERWLWLGAVLVVSPAAFHYANGFAQFGMRYLLDAIPFLSALIFLALEDGRAFGYTALLAASIAMNAYGVAYTTVYGLK